MQNTIKIEQNTFQRLISRLQIHPITSTPVNNPKHLSKQNNQNNNHVIFFLSFFCHFLLHEQLHDLSTLFGNHWLALSIMAEWADMRVERASAQLRLFTLRDSVKQFYLKIPTSCGCYSWKTEILHGGKKKMFLFFVCSVWNNLGMKSSTLPFHSQLCLIRKRSPL